MPAASTTPLLAAAALALLPAAAVADYVLATNFAGAGCSGAATVTLYQNPAGCATSSSMLSTRVTCINASAYTLAYYASSNCVGSVQSSAVTVLPAGCAPSTLLPTGSGPAITTCVTSATPYVQPTAAAAGFTTITTYFDATCETVAGGQSRLPYLYQQVALGTCMPSGTGVGSSAPASCDGTDLSVATYATSTTCSGPSTVIKSPLGCSVPSAGIAAIFLCTPGSSGGGGGNAAVGGAASPATVGGAVGGVFLAVAALVGFAAWKGLLPHALQRAVASATGMAAPRADAAPLMGVRSTI